MTRDDVDRLLAQAVREAEPNELYKYRFAKLVAAAEREECAKICGKIADSVSYESRKSAMQCYEAIRERGAQ
jgi:hypothetical protein